MEGFTFLCFTDLACVQWNTISLWSMDRTMLIRLRWMALSAALLNS